MASRGSRAASEASSTPTFRTANTPPTHSREPSKQTPKMWARPPTPPHHDDHSDTASFTTKRDSLIGADTDSFYSHFRSRNLSRTNSIYSISRVSFTNQITQLTSISLPDANSLSGSISAIQTAPKASRALNDAAGQIQAWINKASEVLDGLDARDDIDWAAQAGRDGLNEVDGAISKFDSLVNVYVTAVERLEMREDAGDIPGDDLQQSVSKLEGIISEWQRIKNSLNTVKRQVELSLEWEELSNSVVQEAFQECEKLTRQVFELEEQRHRGNADAQPESTSSLDLGELEEMIDKRDQSLSVQKQVSTRYNGPKQEDPSHHALIREDDSDLLGLFAQMQPLRAQLDFLPMRIQNFQSKAQRDFPTACGELDDRRDHLEEQWQKLETDAESLRKELSEDKWLLVFRNAGKQALKMIESVDRSITKLDEALDPNTQLRHAPATMKKIENYETKKLHYCPAIERVIALVDRGVRDRLTVNGEIIRLQNDVQNKWQATRADLKNLDSTLEYYHATETRELRDSVSSAISTDRSFLSSNVGSVGSSPASSAGPASRAVSRTRPSQSEHDAPFERGARSRQPSSASVTSSRPPMLPKKRFSSLPVPITPTASKFTQHSRTPLSQSSAAEKSPASRSSTPMTPRTPLSARPPSRLSQTPSSATASVRPTSRLSQTPSSSGAKPRWNASTSLSRTPIGHNFRPMAVTEPSPYRKVVTPVKYTPPGMSHRQSSLGPVTPPSTTRSRQTSNGYSPSGSVLGSPSPQLQPGSLAKLRRPSSLALSQSANSELPTSPGSEVVDLESPTSTTTQPNTRPPSTLGNRNGNLTSGAPLDPIPSKQRLTSAGTLGNVTNGKLNNKTSKPALNKKRSEIGTAPKR
ncbi:MAG: hypothetical protein Q9162_002136 [Coniocarpon cinnabarinum]